MLIGTQGWNYDAWVGPFYPTGTRATDFLSTYTRAFDTVEVDSTFYAIPPEKTVRGWVDRSTAQFRFALKLPQEITHQNRLRASEFLVRQFLERARVLGPKLGPVLIQLGPDFAPTELPVLVDFLPLLPNDLRFAVEFRQPRWLTDAVLALLRDYGIALALTDGRWIPRQRMLALASEPTAPFVYMRWMGPNRHVVDYSHIQFDRTRETASWTAVIARLADRGVDVYGYVNNHFSGHSPATARDLQRQLGQVAIEPDRLGDQMMLF
ncbi:MAG: DUF72 domain-containing protein [Gemmatimonadaceae bacterium]